MTTAGAHARAPRSGTTSTRSTASSPREVLRSAPAGSEPDELVDSWIEGNPASARTLQTIGDVRSGQSYDLTTLPVAVREVRNLIGG